MTGKKKVGFADLFSGVGGFPLGLSRASPRYECVWSCDNDRAANLTYYRRWPESVETHHPGDVRRVATGRVPDHDLLCAGFPCQAFSVAGQRKGFKDKRGNVFFEIPRIARAKRPKILLLENVEGLLSAKAGLGTGIYRTTKGEAKGELTDDLQRVKDEPRRGWEEVEVFVGKGYCFFRIVESLLELGYWVEWQVLNSKDFGVPQNRERVFIVGHLGNRGGREVFPVGQAGEDLDGTQEAPRGGGSRVRHEHNRVSRSLRVGGSGREENLVARTIKRRYYKDGSENLIASALIQSQGRESHVETRSDSVSHALKGKGGWEGNYVVGVTLANLSRYGQGVNRTPLKKDDSSWALNAAGDQGIAILSPINFEHKAGDGTSTRKRVLTDTVPSLQAKAGHTQGSYLLEKLRIRRLTPVECERLQAFPDGWTKELSDTQRYKVLGDAVTVNVIEFLGKRILRRCFDG